MSIRRQQKKLIAPILNILKDCLEQSNKEILSQQNINQVIVEELLQMNVISTVHSPSSLRLIIYQLILFASQQSISNNCCIDGSVSFKRISNLLHSIKEFLKDFSCQNEQTPLRNMDKRYSKQTITTQRTNRNKKRIFSSYYTQYCSLLDQMDTNYGQSNIQSNYSYLKASEDQALIDQLQNLVFKKQSTIQSLEREIQQYRHAIIELGQEMARMKLQHKEVYEEKMCLEEERNQLKSSLLQIIKNTANNQEEQLETGKFIWEDGEKTVSNINIRHEGENEDLMKCLISQALIIQALIQ